MATKKPAARRTAQGSRAAAKAKGAAASAPTLEKPRPATGSGTGEQGGVKGAHDVSKLTRAQRNELLDQLRAAELADDSPEKLWPKPKGPAPTTFVKAVARSADPQKGKTVAGFWQQALGGNGKRFRHGDKFEYTHDWDARRNKWKGLPSWMVAAKPDKRDDDDELPVAPEGGGESNVDGAVIDEE